MLDEFIKFDELSLWIKNRTKIQNPSVMSTMTSLHAPSHMSELSVTEGDAGELTHQVK